MQLGAQRQHTLGDILQEQAFAGGGALSFTQLALCPSNCTGLPEEQRQRSALRFALWVQAMFHPDVTLGLWHCGLSLRVWEEKKQTGKC